MIYNNIDEWNHEKDGQILFPLYVNNSDLSLRINENWAKTAAEC